MAGSGKAHVGGMDEEAGDAVLLQCARCGVQGDVHGHDEVGSAEPRREVLGEVHAV